MTKRAARTKRRRKSFGEMDMGRMGLLGLVTTVAVLALALNIGKLLEVVGNATYTADFAEAGGLRGGDDVRVAGLQVGKVNHVELVGSRVKVTFGLTGARVGDQTRAVIKSDNALGSKFLAIEPLGAGTSRHIPISRTDAGFAINEELGKLTASTAEIDAKKLARSFDSITSVLNETPTEFRSALQGVGALSRTLSTRDAELRTLLQKASSVSSVLASRNREVTSILGDGSQLFAELTARREVLQQLLRNVEQATKQLTGLARDNKISLRPALKELRASAKLFTDYRGTLDFALEHLAIYVRSLGEAVASGPFFQVYISNITSPEDLALGGLTGILEQTGQ